MFVSGDPLRSPGPRGEQIRDASFLIWFNGSDADCEVRLPENAWVQTGTVVMSTDDQVATGTSLRAGEAFDLCAQSLVVLQEA